MKKKRPSQKFGVEVSADEMRAAFKNFFEEHPEIAEEMRRKNAERKNEQPKKD